MEVPQSDSARSPAKIVVVLDLQAAPCCVEGCPLDSHDHDGLRERKPEVLSKEDENMIACCADSVCRSAKKDTLTYTGEPNLDLVNPRALAWIIEKKGTVIADPSMVGETPKKVVLKCDKGHKWKVRMGNLIYNKSWCPDCYGNRRSTIEDMQTLAENRGGKCISPVYVNNKTKLNWECSLGHGWSATPGNVKNHGSWCPHCRVNVGEELVRASLEEAFPDQGFDRTRILPWMDGLELDGFNAELCLAFEYQGKQHSEKIEHFHRTEGAFEDQLRRDARKRELCADNGITLIEISHVTKFVDIRDLVRFELTELGYDIQPIMWSQMEFYDRIRAIGNTNDKMYARVLEIVAIKGGVCMSEQYVGYRVPLFIKCRKGHLFKASLESIDQPASRGPRFCQICGGTKKKDDEELREYAASIGWVFHSATREHDEGGRTRCYLNITCPNGHPEPRKSLDNFKIRDGKPKRGCMECANKNKGKALKLNISRWEDEHNITCRGGYKSNATVCYWDCDDGHVVYDSYNELKKKTGGPCTECFLKTFEIDHDLTCLSVWGKDVDRINSKLDWECNTCGKRLCLSVKDCVAHNKRIDATGKPVVKFGCPTCAYY